MRLINASDFGQVIRAARTAQKLTQTEVAAACGTGVRFIVDLEKGKPSCELEKALTVAAMLGISIAAQLPDGADD